MADVANFHDTHPLNSRLVKTRDGKLVEEVYRAGTPDGKVPPGMYAPFLAQGQRIPGRGARHMPNPARTR